MFLLPWQSVCQHYDVKLMVILSYSRDLLFYQLKKWKKGRNYGGMDENYICD